MIFNDTERGIHTVMILLELQKVLDLLDHKIWLEKTKCIGFSDKK